MIYKSSEGDLDLTKITRLYPAVVVDMQGERAEMSLEWEELYGEKVAILHWILVFDFAPLNEDLRKRTTLVFPTKKDLLDEIQKVAPLLA
jgi:hypothetical protein